MNRTWQPSEWSEICVEDSDKVFPARKYFRCNVFHLEFLGNCRLRTVAKTFWDLCFQGRSIFRSCGNQYSCNSSWFKICLSLIVYGSFPLISEALPVVYYLWEGKCISLMLLTTAAKDYFTWNLSSWHTNRLQMNSWHFQSQDPLSYYLDFRWRCNHNWSLELCRWKKFLMWLLLTDPHQVSTGGGGGVPGPRLGIDINYLPLK